MHAVLGALVLVLLAAGLVEAADEPVPRSPQAQRMSDCNAEARAKSLSGDERKSFMSQCLKSHGSQPAPATPAGKSAPAKPADAAPASGQAEKMKACNQEAATKNLHGDDRRHFMSDCLKAKKS